MLSPLLLISPNGSVFTSPKGLKEQSDWVAQPLSLAEVPAGIQFFENPRTNQGAIATRRRYVVIDVSAFFEVPTIIFFATLNYRRPVILTQSP